MKKCTKEYIIDKIVKIHGDIYKFDNFIYESYKKSVKLICNYHGEFEISPVNLIGNKRGCQKCGLERKEEYNIKQTSSNKEFIGKCKKKYGDKYIYDDVVYVNWKTPVIIICQKHGKFLVTPNEHLFGKECRLCKLENRAIKTKVVNPTKEYKLYQRLKKSQEVFISISKEIHSGKYDYSLVKYVGVVKKVKIICPKHGIFEQTPHHHKNGNGCASCAYENSIGNLKMDTIQFISISIKKHNGYYKYDLSNYDGFKKKVKIICPKHGIFEQIPSEHMKGRGCKRCRCGGHGGPGRNLKYTNDEFIKMCSEKHNNKYSYYKTDFTGVKNKIDVICPTHGVFEVEAWCHKNGSGCSQCALDDQKTKTSDFLVKSNKLHNNKYEYLISGEYALSKDKILIKCPDHGMFEQISDTHLRGSGCSLCKTKSRGEIQIKQFLDDNRFEYIREKTFDDCVNSRKLRFDFYLPKYNMCIEFDGRHHFGPVSYFGGEKTYKIMIKTDIIKNKYCESNNIRLVRIPYFKLKEIKVILQKEIIENDKLQT